MKKEGRIARHLRTAQEISREPHSIVPRARGWLVALWQARGGGYYGLGYIITFFVLEVITLTAAVGGASVTGFIAAQAVQYVLRLSVESILNGVLALLWPIYLWRWLGPSGLVVFAAGFAAFEFGLRPLVENWLPELKLARIERERLKQEKRERRRQKRAK